MSTVTSFLHAILHYVRAGWNYIFSLIHRRRSRHPSDADTNNGILFSLFTGQRRTVKFDDSGIQVAIGNQIAEGGFSYIFEAYPMNLNDNSEVDNELRMKFVLKRINCSNNRELIQACKSEANVHRVLFQSSSASSQRTTKHPNLLELLGLKFDNRECCYMLFTYIPHSLRGEITKRNILNEGSRQRMPFSTREVLQIFGGLVDALIAMHDANLSHRDVKIENVLLKKSDHCGYRVDTTDHYIPVLMDYGSAGPLKTTIQVMNMSSLQQQQHQMSSLLSTTTTKVVEDASMFTTMAYRPPELFEGGLSTMKYTTTSEGADNVLDYGKVDVWSLGCVLFGLMHGASPFEMEFLRTHNDNYHAYYHTNQRQKRQQEMHQQRQQFGLVRIIECTHLKILGEVPFPPWSTISSENEEGGGGGTNGKYPLSLYRFVQYMVHPDRSTRPHIHEVEGKFDDLHLELLGEPWISHNDMNRQQRGGTTHSAKGNGVENLNHHDDFDSLIASRRGG